MHIRKQWLHMTPWSILNLALIFSLLVPLVHTRALHAHPAPISHEETALSFSHAQEEKLPPGTAWRDLPPELKAKVDPRILAELNGEIIPAHLGGGGPEHADIAPTKREPLERTRFIVYLKAKADLKAVRQRHFTSRVAQRNAVFDALVSTAQATQGPVKALLDTHMSTGDVASYQTFYIFNGFAVEGDLETLIALAQRDDVERIVANYPKVYYNHGASGAMAPLNDLGGLHSDNWNIDLVDAEKVWNEFGITGQDAVVAVYDTGADWSHPALQPRYRGYSPFGTDHNYHWFETDPNLYAGGDLGPSVTTIPDDPGVHGTHVLGTMVGDGGTSGTQVGMAPGAQWIAIRDQLAGSYGDDISTHKAFQWLLAPTDLTGQLSTADPSKAPDVINCSWGIASPADDFLEPDIAALRAAGVAVVFAAGNPSAGDGSIGSPGSAPSAITVGATDINDNVASFSGRGPSFWQGEQKPEVSAPGVNVFSTVPLWYAASGYEGGWSGTSMASPAASGLVALLVSADLQDGIRDLDVDDIENFLTYTALDLGPTGFDNDYGYGRIDAYTAVRWARSAGDLQGTITDQSNGLPIAGAVVTGTTTNPGDTFTTMSGATGAYSTTVPAGTYNIMVNAWGYQGDTFNGQTVVTGALSIKDFALTPLPTAQLTGQVLSGTTPISGALVTVIAHPTTQFTTGADGAYTLTLPIATHAMVVEATGYRILYEDVTVTSGGSTHDFAMTPAPTILLVEADRAFGWFYGNPVKNYIGWALDYENYLYDEWEIQYTTFTGTQVITGSILGYGVPTTSTLRAYDIVLWAHGGGFHHPLYGSSDGYGGSPAQVNANDELADYLDAGGRLMLSGQDIGYWEDGDGDLYDSYVRADLLNEAGAFEGEAATGTDFLSGLGLTLTDASLKGYANGVTYFYPDAVEAQDGSAYSAMEYDNGSGSAVLAVDPCDAGYRMIYVAAGLEAFAPRTAPIPAYAEMVDRSLDWLGGSKPAYDVTVSAAPTSQTDEPGNTVTYDVQVANTGAMTDTFTMTVSGNAWTTRIYSGSVELTETVDIPPCNTLDLTLEVDIPGTANTGDKDTATVTATGNASDSVDVTTVAFPTWQIEPSAPYAASRVSLAAWGNSIYLMGGDNGEAENYEFNACTSQWITHTSIPTPTRNHAAAALNGKIYVVGGATGSVMDDLQIYDIDTDSWTSGAPMPDARWAHAAVALDGELYVVGGMDSNNNDVATTFVYSPTLNSWRTVAPMAAPRSWVTGAALDGKLYILGGSGELNTVEAYAPATDTWATKASMLQGRAAAGAASVGEYLYVVGGGYSTYLSTAERYNPTTDTWEAISALNTGRRTLGVAYAAGKLFAAAGWNGSYRNDLESLRFADTFCLSDKAVVQSEVQPGDRITYTVELHSDAITLTTASVTDPVPAGTTWAGFGNNAAGATYNAGQAQVEWSGSLAAGADPLSFTFGVDVAAAGWNFGDLITNTAVFDSGTGQIFTRTTTTRVTFPDPTPSTKTVNVDEALAGDVLTYTVRIENASDVSDTFTMTDPIPTDTTYVPGSLTYTLGTAGYDAVGDVITWTSDLPTMSTYNNTSGDYEWGDSDGDGVIPDVAYNWVDISGSGTAVYLGDDDYDGPLGIGFNFDFYGNTYTDFYASSNGFLSFGSGSTDPGNDPITSTDAPNNIIALMWDDLDPGDTSDPVYYETFAACPVGSGQCLVVQYDDFCHWVGGPSCTKAGTFEAILYDSGAILVQFLDAGDEEGSGSTTGIENSDGTQGVEYAYNSTVLHDELAVLFLPDGTIWQSIATFADITFAVTTTASLPGNTWITNTATLSGPLSTVERQASTFINPLDLSASTKTVDKTWAGTGDTVTYDFLLVNTGLMTATAVLTDPIPVHTAYVSGSVACGGTCSYNPGMDTITWHGDVAPGAPVSLTFAVTLTDTLVDLTPITNTATLDDGAGSLHELTDTFVARSPNLGASFKQADPEQVHPGDTVTYTVYVRNTGFAPGDGQVYDALPPELSYQSGSLICGSGACGEAAGVITWTGTVPGRSMVPVQFQATVPAAASHGDVITNTATITDVSWNTPYTAEAPVTVVEPADLWLTKHSTATVEAGATFVYTLTYGNAGPFNAVTPAQVVDTLPASVRYLGASPMAAYDAISGTVTWDMGTLNAGISGTLLLTVSTPMTMPATVLTNTADITITPRDSDPANNAITITTQITPSAEFFNLRLAPVQATHYGEPGTAVNYTLEVMNTGNTTDTFDITFAGNTWNTTLDAMAIGPMVANRDGNIVVTVDIPANALDGDTDTVTVTVMSRGDPTRSADARLTTEVGDTYGVTVSPNAATQSGDPGEMLTYTLQVKNTGSASDTFDVTLTGHTWSMITAPTTVGPLAAGATTDINVTVTVPQGAADAETDVVDVTVTSQSDNGQSATATLVTVARYLFGLHLTARTTTDAGQPGTTVTYTLQITNTSNVTEVFNIATGGTWPRTAAATVGPLAVNVGTSFEVVVHIPDDAPEDATDVTTVTASAQRDPTASEHLTLTTQASATYGVAVTPDTAMQSGAPGTAVTYTLHVTNTGNTTDTFDVTLTGHTWDTLSTTTAIGPLPANGTDTMIISVNIPGDATDGSTDVVTITMTSQGDATVAEDVALTTEASIAAGYVYGVAVTPAPATQSGAPGTTVTYTLHVTNTGDTTDTFDVTLGGHTWDTTGSATTVGPLSANGTDTMIVTVNIPGDATDGSTDVVTITVTSQGDATVAEDVALTTEASVAAGYVYGVTVTPVPAMQSGAPGTTVTYTLHVTNTGDTTDTFDVDLADNTWDTTPSASSVGPLSANGMDTLTVNVDIPASASEGMTDTATVILTSQGDATISEDVPLTTEAIKAGWEIYLPLLLRNP